MRTYYIVRQRPFRSSKKHFSVPECQNWICGHLDGTGPCKAFRKYGRDKDSGHATDPCHECKMDNRSKCMKRVKRYRNEKSGGKKKKKSRDDDDDGPKKAHWMKS